MWDTYIKDNLNLGVVRPIAEVLLASPASSIDIQSIPADWSHLLAVVHARSDNAAINANLFARFNNDATAVYDDQALFATGSSVTGLEGLAGTSITAGQIPGASALGNVFGSTYVILADYANATQNKTLLGFSGLKWNTTTGSLRIRIAHGQWRSNAAINRLTILASAGNLIAGSKVSLLGVGGI